MSSFDAERPDLSIAGLNRLWRSALDTTHHAAGCGCCGGHSIQLDAATLEEDILFYLRRAYAPDQSEVLEMLDMLDRQPADRTRSFPARIAALSATASPLALKTLLSSLTEILQGIAGGKPATTVGPHSHLHRRG